MAQDDRMVRGLALLRRREAIARRKHVCSTCGARTSSAEAAARCVAKAPRDRKPYHVTSTAEQRTVREGARTAVAVYYAQRTVRAIEDILAEEGEE